MSRLSEYLREGKKMKNTMVGYGVNKSRFKQLSDYIKSWLVRYDIEFKEVKEPHFSIAQITGTYEKDNLVREISKTPSNIKFIPIGMKIFRGIKVPRDFIVIEYKANNDFVNVFKHIQSNYDVRLFGEIKPHISLFNIEQGVMDDIMFDKIQQSIPNIPTITPDSKVLFNDKFKIEFEI